MERRERNLNPEDNRNVRESLLPNRSNQVDASTKQKQFLVAATVVLGLLSVIAGADQLPPPAASSTSQQAFDLEEYRLPKSIVNLTTRAGEEAAATGRDGTHQQHGSQFNLFGASQRNQISAQAQPTAPPASVGANEPSSSAPIELSSIAGLEDLLAVETTRLLTIGRQHQPQAALGANSSHQAPYATTISRSSNASSEQDEPSERQFFKLLRAQPPPPPAHLPVFIPQSFGPSSAGGPHNAYQQHQAPHLPVAVSSTVWQQPAPAGDPKTADAAPAFGGRPVTTAPAPHSWSPYSDFVLSTGNSSGRQVASPTADAASNSTRSSSNLSPNIRPDWDQPGFRESAAAAAAATATHQNGSSASVDRIRQQVSPADASAKSVAVGDDPTTTAHQRSQFPSLLSPKTQTGEDQFEQSVSLNSSRPNSTANMSWGQLLKQATESNAMESLMVTNKSMVSLLCETSDMLLRLKFRQPFSGVVMTNLDRRRVCRLFGNGSRYYEMSISLRDCGTRQEMPRLFINNIQIQFNNPLEREQSANDNWPGAPAFDAGDDEVKTIICSYPLRPRAPPPPAGLPERIIELLNNTRQQDDQPVPAKLVYYEPLLLISGLLLLALALTGLTTSAYLLRRRRQRLGRPRRSVSSASFSSSRLYRNSPAQLANRLSVTPPLTQPPVIGLADSGRDRSGGSSLKSQREAPKRQDALTGGFTHGTVVEKPYRWRTLSAGARAAAETDNKANVAAGRQRVVASLPKSALKKDFSANVSVVNLRAAAKSRFEQHPDSADSLATKHDQTSVTTIEIPYAGSAQQTPAGRLESHPLVPKKSQALMKRFPPSAGNDGPSARRSSEDHSQVRRLQQQQQPPRFGSLRATLTSPDEFKRLQEIARLFDEILIEKHVDKGEEGTIVVYNSRLIPSKYKTKIIDRMSEQERRLACSILSKDEVFRSLVVESTDRKTFRRKLRNNPIYADKFSRDAWQLLEEILLDPELSSEGASGSPDEASAESSSPSASSYSIATRPPALPPPPPPPVARVDQRQIKSISHAAVGESKRDQPAGNIADDNESIVAEFDTRQRELPNRQDSLNSPSSSILAETSLTKGSKVLVEDKSATQITRRRQQGEPALRVSQFNSTSMSRQVAGLAGTLINIDSVTNFTSSEDFSTYTRSSIEHGQLESANRVEDSLPYVDEDERVGSYEYAKETYKSSPKLGTNRTTTILQRQPPTPPKPITNNNNNNSIKYQSVRRINR